MEPIWPYTESIRGSPRRCAAAGSGSYQKLFRLNEQPEISTYASNYTIALVASAGGAARASGANGTLPTSSENARNARPGTPRDRELVKVFTRQGDLR